MQNRRSISPHAGRCRNFTLTTVVHGREVGERTQVSIEKEQTLHSTTSEGLPSMLEGVELLITGGVGPGLVQRLARHGVQVAVTDEADPDRALQAWLVGDLHPEAPGAESDGGRGNCF